MSATDATEFIQSVIDAELLKSGLYPAVTGREPFHALVEDCNLWMGDHPIATELRTASISLARVDDELQATTAAYNDIASLLPGAASRYAGDHLFRVNLIKPADTVTLGPEVLDQVYLALDVWQRVAIPDQTLESSFAEFRRQFADRFDRRFVRLVDVFDYDTGLQWSRDADVCLPSVLRGLSLRGESPTSAETQTPTKTRIQAKVERARHDGLRAVFLDREDLQEAAALTHLPDAFQVGITLVADSEEAISKQQFQLVLEGVTGPPGARVFGRYCNSDPRLRALVKRHLEAEEALRPDAIYAEIVYSPTDHVQNVVLRPILRQYEIPYLGRSGLPVAKQIPITDILVSIVGGRIVLYSRRLRREVIPRLTTAHSEASPGCPAIYKFLCGLARLGVPAVPLWSSRRSSAVFTPRIVFEKIILGRATWTVDGSTLRQLWSQQGLAQFDEWRHLRRQLKWDRYIVFVEGESGLVVDLDNPLSVGAIAPLLAKRPDATFMEWLPGPSSCASGPEGRFAHELIIPFTRTRTIQRETEVGALAEASIRAEADERSFAIWSEWAHVKLYAGPRILDRALLELVKPAAEEWCADGLIDRWFFVRYADPHTHLRLRFRCRERSVPSRLLRDLRSMLEINGLGKQIWRIQWDSYEREIERYGGRLGIELAEEMFHHDSEAALRALDSPTGRTVDERWKLALASVDCLLQDLGFEIRQRLALVASNKEGLWAEMNCPPRLRQELGASFRKQRATLEGLLNSGPSLFEQRSTRNRKIAAEIRALESTARLSVSRQALAQSFVHMSVNRLLPTDHRAQELLICDFLEQLYSSRLARVQKSPQVAGIQLDTV